MSKIKVYELAKELDVPSKDVLEFLGSNNIEEMCIRDSPNTDGEAGVLDSVTGEDVKTGI